MTSIYFRAIRKAGWLPYGHTPALFMREQQAGDTVSSSGSLPSSWALRDMAVYVPGWHPSVVYVQPNESFVMDSVRVRANAFFAQNPPTYNVEANCTNNFVVLSLIHI